MPSLGLHPVRFNVDVARDHFRSVNTQLQNGSAPIEIEVDRAQYYRLGEKYVEVLGGLSILESQRQRALDKHARASGGLLPSELIRTVLSGNTGDWDFSEAVKALKAFYSLEPEIKVHREARTILEGLFNLIKDPWPVSLASRMKNGLINNTRKNKVERATYSDWAIQLFDLSEDRPLYYADLARVFYLEQYNNQKPAYLASKAGMILNGQKKSIEAGLKDRAKVLHTFTEPGSNKKVVICTARGKRVEFEDIDFDLRPSDEELVALAQSLHHNIPLSQMQRPRIIPYRPKKVIDTVPLQEQQPPEPEPKFAEDNDPVTVKLKKIEKDETYTDLERRLIAGVLVRGNHLGYEYDTEIILAALANGITPREIAKKTKRTQTAINEKLREAQEEYRQYLARVYKKHK